MTRPELAESLFRSGYNCAQSVVMAFAPDFGLSREEAERISAAFGGGFSRLRETCGTVSGAAMVLSLRYGAGTGSDREKKTHLYTVVQDFAKRSRRSTALTFAASCSRSVRGRIHLFPRRAPRHITAGAPARSMSARQQNCWSSICEAGGAGKDS